MVMTPPVPLTRAQTTRLLLAVVVTWALANGAFFAVSAQWLARAGSIRGAFLVLSTVLGAASFGAAVAPRWIGHAIAFVVSIAAFVAGCAALNNNLPTVLGVTLTVVGIVAPALAYYSLRHSRAAWSALIAILAVFGVVTLFGAPKLRGLLHLNLASALIAPGLMTIAVMALAAVRDDYRERA